MDNKTQAIALANAVLSEQIEKLVKMIELLNWLRQWFPSLIVGGTGIPSNETVETWNDSQLDAYATDCQTPIMEYADN